MHLCFVAPHAWPVLSRDPNIQVVGGAEVQQSILARRFAAAGYRVSMICCDYGQPERVTVDGITVHRVFQPEAGLPVLRFLHPRLSSVWQAMREADADVYYQRSSAVWTGVVAAFCRIHGRRSIYAGASDRDFDPARLQIRYARDRWIYRRGLKTVDRIVAQNARQVETCRANFGRDSVLIQSCYDPPAGARMASPDNDVVLWVGTVHSHKRPEMLLEIARRLPQRRFVMIGGPSSGERFRAGFFESIRAGAAELGNVQFTGFLPLAQVEPWFDRARLLVCTSVYEGLPNVFLQAWARGVPVVSTVDIGAPVNTLFDSVEEGAQEIEALFENRDRWSEASAIALAHYRANHSPEHVLKSYDELLAGLAA
jgi:glycosyltransferase involved in cell wall biosynthesis